MGPIVIVEGADCERLADYLRSVSRALDSGQAFRVRFAIDNGLKIKVNGGVWSSPIGRIEKP